MPNRAQDWLRQAERDLEQAEDSRRASRPKLASLAAHQPEEKAVTTLPLRLRQETWGHGVGRLLVDLPETAEVPEVLIEK